MPRLAKILHFDPLPVVFSNHYSRVLRVRFDITSRNERIALTVYVHPPQMILHKRTLRIIKSAPQIQGEMFTAQREVDGLRKRDVSPDRGLAYRSQQGRFLRQSLTDRRMRRAWVRQTRR